MIIRFKKKELKFNISQIICFSYLGIILIGSVLLSMPFSFKPGHETGFLTALFTSTSATCVTGLSVVDVWSTYSFFGQFILLLLMEAGGLGFMSIVSILFYIVNHKNDVNTVLLMSESLGSDDKSIITRIQKRLLIGSFAFEGIGAIILSCSFIPSMGLSDGIWSGIFHAVSAFCNAGFDILGKYVPGSSLETVNGNPVILITIALLIIIGGIGFVVWDDIASLRKTKHLTYYSHMVLQITFVLLVIGTVLFFIFEYNNPDTIGNMSLFDKIVNSFFQSATPRTAGFASISQANYTESSKALTCLLMIIGGSSGSTAGGIKTVTFFILLKTIYSVSHGSKNVVIKHRTILNEQIMHAFSVASGMCILSLVGAIVLHISSYHISLVDCIYESISAIATVGLSLGITSSLSAVSLLTLIVLMFIGRVGLLTLTIGFFKTKENKAIKYPSVKLILG